MNLRSLIAARPLTSFVAVGFGFTWLFWVTALLLYPASMPVQQRLPGQLLVIIGSFGPFLAGAIVARATGAWPEFVRGLTRWRLHPGWYLLVVALPLATFVLAYLVYRLTGGPPLDFARAVPLSVLPGALLATLLIGGGNEEPGWRGYALGALEARFGPLVGTLLLGALWGIWHLPAFLDPASSQSTVPLAAWVIGLFANTVALTWLYNRTGSVLLAALYHALFNLVGTWPATALPLDGFARLYWIAVLLYAGFVIALLFATRTTLGYRVEQVPA